MNLAGSTPGATYTAVMTASSLNPVGGTIYRVEWGNGTGTNLFLGNGIVGIGTSTTVHTALTSEATVQRSVVFGDEAGRVAIAADRKVVLGSNFATSSTSASDVTGLVLTLPVGTWLVTIAGQYRSTNTDSGARFTAVATSATLHGGGVCADIENVPTANTDIGLTGNYLVTVASGTGTLQIQAACDEGSRTLTVMAGTFLCAVRIA